MTVNETQSGGGTLTRRLLHGLLVVELARGTHAAYLGRLLAEYGADVIKVELPAGVSVPASVRHWLDAGKQSVVLDWSGGPAVDLLRRLLSRADALIEDQEPGALTAAGLESAALRESNPRLVHTTVTDFGSDGPWAGRPGSDLVISALGSLSAINGLAGEPPTREPGEQTALLAAMFGFVGTLTALLNRAVTGRGQRVDIAALEAVVSALTPNILAYSYQGVPIRQRQPGNELLLPCADGWLSLTPYPDRAWEMLTALYALPVDPDDPRFATGTTRRQHAAAVREIIQPALASRTRRELFEDLSAMRVVCGMVLRPEELPDDPHLSARGSFPHAAGTGAPVLPGPPFRVAGERPEPPAPPPTPGTDIDALLDRIGLLAARDERVPAQ